MTDNVLMSRNNLTMTLIKVTRISLFIMLVHFVGACIDSSVSLKTEKGSISLPSLVVANDSYPAVIGTTKIITVNVVTTGSDSISSPEFSLPQGIQFEGGRFPGTTGTCSSIITSDCTLTFTYTPMNNSEVIKTISMIKFGASTSISLVLRGTSRIESLSSGLSYNSCGVNDLGQIKCWGDKSHGIIGHSSSDAARGDEANEMGDNLPAFYLSTPSDIPLSLKSSSHGNHFCAIFSSGKLKCFGLNNFGQLGYGDFVNRFDVDLLGSNLPFVNLGTNFKVSDVAIGTSFTCALSTLGKVKCWGANTKGQLALGNLLAKGYLSHQMGDNLPFVNLGTNVTATAIAANSASVCAILNNGDVKCWGENSSGQLGLGDTADRGDHPGEMGDALSTVDLGTNLTAEKIFGGYSNFCVITATSKNLKCWGSNGQGKLGLGDTANRGDGPGEMGDALSSIDLGSGFIPEDVVIALTSICAKSVSGALKCWGGNSAGQLGKGNIAHLGDGPGEMGDSLSAINLGAAFSLNGLSAGQTFICARSNTGVVKCWGGNAQGQLGIESTLNIGDGASEMGDALIPVNFGAGLTVSQIASANQYSCALFTNNSLKCWGRALGTVFVKSGVIGGSLSTVGPNLAPLDLGSGLHFVKVALGRYHACALTNDSRVKCWGDNTSGELGYGDVTPRGPGPSLPFVELPAGDTIVDIKAGIYHTCILTINGQVRCWGSGQHGQLGHGSTSNIGDAPGEMGENLPAVDLGTGLTVVQFAIGHQHNCAVLSNDSLKCWGRNSDGQLGLGDTLNRGDGPTEMGNNLATVNLGTNLKAIQVSGNYYSTCALLNTNQIKCWGNNTNGVLGQGHSNKLGDGANEMGDSLAAIDLGADFSPVEIESGAYHSCALSDAGKVKCWGAAGSGQLANGITLNIGDAPSEMGDNIPYSNLGSAPVTNLYLESYQTCFGYADKSIRCNGALGGQAGGYLAPDSGSYGWSSDLLGDIVPNFWF